MASTSKIQWTGGTWNPWTGCRKVSPGCKFCYMYRDKERYGKDPKEVIRSKSTFDQPLKWTEPRLIFTCSWSDFFIKDADEWRDDAWDIIRRTPHHTYQILTKRPERVMECLPDDWGDGYPNVWLGVSVENQEMYDARVPMLADIPAAVRFLSLEPLIGPIDVDTKGQYLEHDIHWVIIGGESGNDTGKYRYRRADIKWFTDIITDVLKYGVATFFKQTGTYVAKKMGLKDRHGGDWDEFPTILQVREFPKQ